MRLHEEEKLFRQAVLATAEHFGIPEIFIEKDYWVTYALHAIFHDDIGKETVFKGGTALSKCFGMIKRFSEDIDLVVKHGGEETDNQLKRKIKKIGQVVGCIMPEVKVDGLTRKMGMNRKTAHSYPKTFTGAFGQVRDVIVIEATWFGYYEPFTTQSITSYIHDMMLAKAQLGMIDDYTMQAFEVTVLHPTRTLCEKIMSLVRFSYSDNPVQDLRMKMRHLYDLHMMLRDDALKAFFVSQGFAGAICKVAQDDVQSFRNNNRWLTYHPSQSFLFKDTGKVWGQLKGTYLGDFKGLVYGDLPDEEQILETLVTIRERLADVEWHVSLPE
ncbi:MAG: nucleotidyl transferase AbiEii/AbiGii toxin family protein [Candidatus Electrothrix scaldis]|nr:MAG: nucleotidyl transferase AbiEii/AbiGii toxin family protein [Candidatus Electrothrix sp. GW3-3]